MTLGCDSSAGTGLRRTLTRQCGQVVEPATTSSCHSSTRDRRLAGRGWLGGYGGPCEVNRVRAQRSAKSEVLVQRKQPPNSSAQRQLAVITARVKVMMASPGGGRRSPRYRTTYTITPPESPCARVDSGRSAGGSAPWEGYQGHGKLDSKGMTPGGPQRAQQPTPNKNQPLHKKRPPTEKTNRQPANGEW